jgi:hypothetical protein
MHSWYFTTLSVRMCCFRVKLSSGAATGIVFVFAMCIVCIMVTRLGQDLTSYTETMLCTVQNRWLECG